MSSQLLCGGACFIVQLLLITSVEMNRSGSDSFARFVWWQDTCKVHISLILINMTCATNSSVSRSRVIGAWPAKQCTFTDGLIIDSRGWMRVRLAT
jgi:hypothetical protein